MNRARRRASRAIAAMCAMLWIGGSAWLAGGTAYADDGPHRDSDTSSHTGQDPSPDKPDHDPGAVAHAKPGPAAQDGTSAGKPVRQPHRDRAHAATSPPTSARPDRESKPDTTPTVRRNRKPAAGTAPDAPAPDAKAPAATTTSAVAPLRRATPSVSTAATSAVPNPIKQATQFARQVAGLANDVALIAVSLVNNFAAAAATAIGPKPLWGVPYHVADAIAGTAATAARLLDGSTPLNAGSPGPFKVTYGVGNFLSFLNPTKAPAGANDPSITVSAEHPLPIILVNATPATQGWDWSVGAPVLANAGYKVYSFNYGNTTSNPHFPFQATGDIPASAQELSDEVDRVLAETHADKVILVGHSQGGGIMPEYYLNELGGAARVSQLIGIAPSNHGTDIDGLIGLTKVPILGPAITRVIDLFGAAWLQQAVTSPLQHEVYGDGDTRAGVLYTTISSKFDWLVTPYTQQALTGPNVTNIVLQDQYPTFNAGHFGINYSAPTWAAVLGALAANPEANPLQPTAVAM